MVKVKLLYKQDLIDSIQIYGHAEFAEYGEDLVCAGVSSIGIGALNALDEIFSEDVYLEQGENEIQIRVIRNSDNLQTALNFMYYQLKTMSLVYPQYVKIIRKDEV